MTFNSFSYFLFLPVVYLVFYFTADRWRWLVLLVASYGFYASFKAPYLLGVLLAVTGISYACGLRMAAQSEEALRKRWLWTGSFSCLAILAVLKYLPFFHSAPSSVVISIGVSYFSFQAISYLADVYLEIEEPERHFGRYALFLAFFPKLLQGPIERGGDLLPQLRQPFRFDYDAIRSGMLLFTWGLFRKVVVADRLALYADKMFNNVHSYSGLALIIGVYAYALQIYFDFAGYTDMARGTGRMFGIKLTDNFNSPYLSTSVAEFWRRWHITFSRWILDYIFKPLQLGWRNWGQWGTSLALMITFLISGIWHGATSGFLIWGGLHGIYLVSANFYRPYQKKLYKRLGLEKSRFIKWWQVLVTFNLVSLAWVFFRARTLDDAWYVISNCLNIHSNWVLASELGARSALKHMLMDNGNLDLLCVALALCVTWLVKVGKVDFYSKNVWFRWGCYNALLLTIAIMGVTGHSSYIYFSF